jgi:site-specific recombinase XerD
VKGITCADIERLMVDVSRGKTAVVPKERRSGSIPTGGNGAAAQCVTLMGTLMAFAVKRGLRDDNPAHGVKKPPVRKMERFLSEPEIARLAVAMDDEAGKSGTPYPAAAITGARLRLAVPIAAN